jgi:hypothetical protein
MIVIPRTSPLRGHEKEIVDRYVAGESAERIGASFYVTGPPVFRVLREAGVEMRPRGPYRRPLASREEDVAALYRMGFSLREIAELFGCSVIAVKGALRRLDVALRPRGAHATKDGIALRRALLEELSSEDEPAVRQLGATLAARRQEGGRKRRSPSE